MFGPFWSWMQEPGAVADDGGRSRDQAVGAAGGGGRVRSGGEE
jgi:hypothetical protein